MNAKYRVYFTEYERGWGSRPDGHKDFDDIKSAKEYADKFNSKNDLPIAPDWYMTASSPVLVDLDNER